MWSNGQPQRAPSVQNRVHQPTKHAPALFPLQQQNTKTWIHLRPMPQPSFQYLYSSSAKALNFPRPNPIDLVVIAMATDFKTIFTCIICLEVLLLASEDGVSTTALFVRPFEHLSAESSKSFSLFQLSALCAQLGNAWGRDEAAQCANYGTTVAATTKTAPNRGGARAFTSSP